MRGLLDDEALDGVHEARVTVRLSRDASAIQPDANRFMAEVERLCSLWGGAVTPIISINAEGALSHLYAKKIPGSAIDGAEGLHPHELFDLASATITRDPNREAFWEQLALPLLKYKKQDTYAALEIVRLDPADPWRLIYAACLGTASDSFDSAILRRSGHSPQLRMQDFVNVETVSTTGSLTDLLGRLTGQDRISPRVVSMVHLAYGGSGSTQLRSGKKVLPEPWFPSYDAGPNIVVVCSPGDVEDAMLLWNLRGAHGDYRAAPIGLPLAEASASSINQLNQHPNLSRNGFSARSLYVTSASIPVEQLEALFGQSETFQVASPDKLLTFGTFGWSRDEVMVWSNGRSQFVPLPVERHKDVFENLALNSSVYYRVDLAVADAPFPVGDDVRIDGFDGDIYAGSKTTWGMSRILSEVRQVTWPSRLLISRAVAARRGADLAESEPGRAAVVAIESLDGLGYVGNLAHAPLLKMLEEMAARHGFGWYKQRMRNVGASADPSEAVGPSVDELPERSFSEFKKALGNSEKATRNWLAWAEKSGMIVKGFPLQCELCQAKQWLPVEAFSPPLICRGCAQEISMPFGNRHIVEFKFRLSERLRRVYENDAMGHLLTAHFFDSVMRGRLIGLHPGMEVRKIGATQVVGEADVLVLTRAAELIPIEVKRSSTGITAPELAKLDALVSALESPWSAVAACQYSNEMDSDFSEHEERDQEGYYRRIALSYDRLLDPHLVWTLAGDPFAWTPLTADQIAERQKTFVKRFENWDADRGQKWTDEVMLKNPAEFLRRTRAENDPDSTPGS